MNKSILLVGNGGSLVDSKLGPKIDEFDEVIRINEAKTKFYEEDAGNRFTIWSTFNPEKKFEKYYKGYGNLSTKEIDDLTENVREVWYVTPVAHYLKGWSYKRISSNPTFRHESPSMMEEIGKIIGHATTGFILIYILSTMYDKFYITGFDFGGYSKTVETEWHHYWKNAPIGVEQQHAGHAWTQEYNYVKSLIDKGKVIYLNKNSIIEKSGYIGGGMMFKTCKQCGKESVLYQWENNLCHYCEGLL
jgi:hypothetical protein